MIVMNYIYIKIYENSSMHDIINFHGIFNILFVEMRKKKIWRKYLKNIVRWKCQLKIKNRFNIQYWQVVVHILSNSLILNVFQII